jgi:stringent starvation protein B
MTSQRPYLLRAIYEWIVDNGMTPHVLVNARSPGVRVPPQTVKDGQVVFNIADRAVGKLEMGNDVLRFSARFGGVSQSVVVPLAAVMAIYARETGQGMGMPEEPQATSDTAADAPSGNAPRAMEDTATASDHTQESAPDNTPQPPKRGNHLRIIK